MAVMWISDDAVECKYGGKCPRSLILQFICWNEQQFCGRFCYHSIWSKLCVCVFGCSLFIFWFIAFGTVPIRVLYVFVCVCMCMFFMRNWFEFCNRQKFTQKHWHFSRGHLNLFITIVFFFNFKFVFLVLFCWWWWWLKEMIAARKETREHYIKMCVFC